ESERFLHLFEGRSHVVLCDSRVDEEQELRLFLGQHTGGSEELEVQARSRQPLIAPNPPDQRTALVGTRAAGRRTKRKLLLFYLSSLTGSRVFKISFGIASDALGPGIEGRVCDLCLG